MKDRFLVRYWVKGSKKYLNSNKLVYNDGTYTQVSTKQLPNGKYISYILYDWNTSEVIPEQCTGLKDKNGKLIYEGDIVRRYVGLGKHGSQKTEDIDVVKWHINGYVLENYCDYFADTDDFEVIGNIHENAELLND